MTYTQVALAASVSKLANVLRAAYLVAEVADNLKGDALEHERVLLEELKQAVKECINDPRLEAKACE